MSEASCLERGLSQLNFSLTLCMSHEVAIRYCFYLRTSPKRFAGFCRNDSLAAENRQLSRSHLTGWSIGGGGVGVGSTSYPFIPSHPSIHPSIPLTVYLSVSLPACLPVRLSLCVCVSVSLSLSIYPYVYIYIYTHIHVYIGIHVFLPIFTCSCLFFAHVYIVPLFVAAPLSGRS